MTTAEKIAIFICCAVACITLITGILGAFGFLSMYGSWFKMYGWFVIISYCIVSFAAIKNIWW